MTLVNELSKPAYASMVLAKDYAGLAALFNVRNISVPAKGTFLTELGVLDLLGAEAGDAFLTAIETAAVSFPVLTRIIRWLRSERGIDIGHQEVHSVLLSLVAANVVTSQSANALISYGTKQITLAEKLKLGEVGVGLIYHAVKELGVN